MQLVQQPTVVVIEEKAREAVEEVVERTLSSPEFSAQVTADIRNLTQTVKDIRMGFREVADDLVAFDNDEYKDKDGEVLRLRPRWLGYQAVSKTACLSLQCPRLTTKILTRCSMIYWREATGMRLPHRL